ncbi:hypothetical protein JDV09_10115 [Mycobacterium sp. Y57]|uniref:hypothetical protein n=1 Tax=Mycolicibacterium xanthum TaxID=2796469 RepID=UPI001C85A503|nr:hypothetical protein [Mycolicibacterium xanthum]MBX7432455.1 hypothetical protein [Mycolicibacterium xanthum]
MRDSVVFAQVKSLQQRRESADLSASALEIHVRAVVDSARSPYPAFVADARLDAIAPGPVTTMAALELCLVGLWYRASGGYVIADLDLVERISEPTGRRWLRAVVTYLRG